MEANQTSYVTLAVSFSSTKEPLHSFFLCMRSHLRMLFTYTLCRVLYAV